MRLHERLCDSLDKEINLQDCTCTGVFTYTGTVYRWVQKRVPLKNLIWFEQHSLQHGLFEAHVSF